MWINYLTPCGVNDIRSICSSQLSLGKYDAKLATSRRVVSNPKQAYPVSNAASTWIRNLFALEGMVDANQLLSLRYDWWLGWPKESLNI